MGWRPDPLVETDAAGNNPTEFIFFNGKRIARQDSTGAVSYFLADHLGSPRVLTDASGTVLDDSDFYPFGGERAVISSSGNNYKFTGKERDAESGLDNFKARYFGSSMGRFSSPDPLMILKQKFTDPQQWNMYSYVRNNPLRFLDPTGMYVANCGEGIKNCEKQIQNFEKARQDALKSKDPNIRKAAEAYGKLGDKNGVDLTIAKVVDPKHPDIAGQVTAQAGTGGLTYDLKTNKFQQATQVTVKAGLSGNDLQAVAIHEGVHVEDRAAFVASLGLDLATGNITMNSLLNITGRQSERNAFGVENIFLRSIARPLRNIEDILLHPPYSDNPTIDKPLFSALPGVPQ